MLFKLIFGALALALFVYAARWYLLNTQSEHTLVEKPVLPEQVLEPIVPSPPARGSLLVADISVHTEEELEILFSRVEQLLDRPRGGEEEALFSLVLHGPEVEFFAFKNYPRYKPLVDRAAKLAALGAVQIIICQTRMRSMGIAEDEVPAFLNQVPYGPGEVEQLLVDGYLRM